MLEETMKVKKIYREQVFEAIKAAGERGMTDRELEKKLKLKASTIRPRRYELWKAGRVRIKRSETGAPVYRNYGTRRTATIWVVGEEETCPHCGAVYTKAFKRVEEDE